MIDTTNLKDTFVLKKKMLGVNLALTKSINPINLP